MNYALPYSHFYIAWHYEYPACALQITISQATYKWEIESLNDVQCKHSNHSM